MDNPTIQNIIDQLTDFGFKIVGAILLWIVGKWLMLVAY